MPIAPSDVSQSSQMSSTAGSTCCGRCHGVPLLTSLHSANRPSQQRSVYLPVQLLNHSIVLSQIPGKIATMLIKPIPEFVLFGDSLTAWSFDEETQGFGWYFRQHYYSSVNIVNEGKYSSPTAHDESTSFRVHRFLR